MINYGYKLIALFDITGANGNYNMKLNNIRYEDGEEFFVTEDLKNTYSYNLQYNTSTGKSNTDSIIFSIGTLASYFEDISIDISNSNFSNENGTAHFEIGNSNGEGKGRKASSLLKCIIKENGRIYGLYENGEEVLFSSIAVSVGKDSEFNGVGVCPEENYMTISKQ